MSMTEAMEVWESEVEVLQEQVDASAAALAEVDVENDPQADRVKRLAEVFEDWKSLEDDLAVYLDSLQAEVQAEIESIKQLLDAGKEKEGEESAWARFDNALGEVEQLAERGGQAIKNAVENAGVESVFLKSAGRAWLLYFEVEKRNFVRSVLESAKQWQWEIDENDELE